MFAKERQDKIYSMLQKNGAVRTSNLIKIFDVSIETVRRDLLIMEKKGQLTRVHGGAVAKNDMKPFYDLEKRNTEYNEQKYELSKTAAGFINEGDIIGIDSGSTAICFAEVIKEHFSSLTVITHSLDVFEILRNHKNFSVILCGGNYLRNENAFFGPLVLDCIEKLHMQKSFIFPSAVSLEFGIGDFNSNLHLIQKQLIKSSDISYVLADSSKFEKKALLKLDDMKTDYNYVTDTQLSDELKKLYKENNLNIYTGE